MAFDPLDNCFCIGRQNLKNYWRHPGGDDCLRAGESLYFISLDIQMDHAEATIRRYESIDCCHPGRYTHVRVADQITSPAKCLATGIGHHQACRSGGIAQRAPVEPHIVEAV